MHTPDKLTDSRSLVHSSLLTIAESLTQASIVNSITDSNERVGRVIALNHLTEHVARKTCFVYADYSYQALPGGGLKMLENPDVDDPYRGLFGGFADAHAFMTDLTDDGCFGLWGCWFAFGHVGIAPFVNELYRYSGIDSVFIILGGRHI